MNAQFHTPSFGDEVFDLTDIDANNIDGNVSNSTNNTSFISQQQGQYDQSKRMRGSMDSTLEEYHSANDESFISSNNNSSLITSPTPMATATVAARKQMTSNDPNEPAKPLSAYALFFRDTVSAIKQQNPNCSFQELSRIVASMWEALDPTHKNVYNKKNEIAKNEYVKQMRIYRQQQLEQQQQLDHMNATSSLQSKPAVFTISRTNDGLAGGNINMNSYENHSINSPQHQHQQQQQQQHQQTQHQSMQQQHQMSNQFQQQQTQFQQPIFDMQQTVEIFNQQQPQSQEQLQHNNSLSTPSTCLDSNPPPAQQIQLLTEAGSVQKCIRENCTKRAIINPDWEDEYCSNECVVIHCRNVFNAWVQANLEARTQ